MTYHSTDRDTNIGNTDSLRRSVMRRIYFVRTIRPLLSNAAGAVVLLATSLYLLGREVFVAQIFRNAPSIVDLSAVLRFIEAAFLNTTFMVQALTILAFFGGLWLVRECVRLLWQGQEQLV